MCHIIFKLNIQLEDYLEVCWESSKEWGKVVGVPVLGGVRHKCAHFSDSDVSAVGLARAARTRNCVT